MRAIRIVVILCCASFPLMSLSKPGDADIIKFKPGGAQKCVIVKETDDAVHFINSMGMCKMPRSRIESVQYESEEINATLRKKWKQKKETAQKGQPKLPPNSPKKEEPKSLRTYTVEPTKFKISVAGHAPGIRSAQRVATFIIKDLGVKKGNRLFHVTVTSLRSGTRMISFTDFYALSSNGVRINSRHLKGHPILRASLNLHQTASGHVAFPTDEELRQIVVKSDLSEFVLNLETGTFTSQRGPF